MVSSSARCGEAPFEQIFFKISSSFKIFESNSNCLPEGSSDAASPMFLEISSFTSKTDQDQSAKNLQRELPDMAFKITTSTGPSCTGHASTFPLRRLRERERLMTPADGPIQLCGACSHHSHLQYYSKWTHQGIWFMLQLLLRRLKWLLATLDLWPAHKKEHKEARQRNSRLQLAQSRRRVAAICL